MSKAALKRQAQEILRSTTIGDELSGEHLEFVRQIATPYVYNAETVVGYGVGVSPEHGTKCFEAIHDDGSHKSFGYRRAIDGSSKAQDVLQAFRRAVSDQIHARKRRNEEAPGSVRCEGTGHLVAWDEAQVHHEQPFGELVTTFLGRETLRLVDVPIEVAVDRVVLIDRDLRARWCSFHQEVAVLRVCSTAYHQTQHKAQHE